MSKSASRVEATRNSQPDILSWLLRAQSGGTHIAPGNGNDPFQVVDVKDVARFLISSGGAAHHWKIQSHWARDELPRISCRL
jgi:hypothetical protein